MVIKINLQVIKTLSMAMSMLSKVQKIHSMETKTCYLVIKTKLMAV